MPELRVGNGFDVHQLVTDRPLILGGIKIEHTHGLLGHSDADVLLHAISDALLGAMGLPDIGQQFPPDDESFRDADSGELLKVILKLAREAGLVSIQNIDAIVMAERPKINPHVMAMRERIAGILEIEPKRISIKATTTEKLGFVGREEGIAAQAVCLIKIND